MSIKEAIAALLNGITPEEYAKNRHALNALAWAIDVEAQDADAREKSRNNYESERKTIQ